jgi:hypothetical protein
MGPLPDLGRRKKFSHFQGFAKLKQRSNVRGCGIILLKTRLMREFQGNGTLRATMQNIAHELRGYDGRREETLYGSNDFIYMPLWTSEADE